MYLISRCAFPEKPNCQWIDAQARAITAYVALRYRTEDGPEPEVPCTVSPTIIEASKNARRLSL